MNRLFQRTLRGMTEHLYLTGVGSGVIAAALLLLGGFGLVTANLEGLLAAWNRDAHISAYFKAGTAPAAQAAAQATVAQRAEVASVELVTEAQAAAWMRAQAPDLMPLMDDLGDKALPASLEITLRPDQVNPAAMDAFATSLVGAGSFDLVDYGRDWVGRLDALVSLVRGMGVALAGLTALGTLFLVANTVHLAIYARRDELEIMRLVGATDGYIIGPFALEGALQGLIGSGVAVAALYAVYVALSAQAGTMALAMGQGGLQFLSGPVLAGLLLAGPLGGAGVTTLSTLRFLRRMA